LKIAKSAQEKNTSSMFFLSRLAQLSSGCDIFDEILPLKVLLSIGVSSFASILVHLMSYLPLSCKFYLVEHNVPSLLLSSDMKLEEAPDVLVSAAVRIIVHLLPSGVIIGRANPALDQIVRRVAMPYDPLDILTLYPLLGETRSHAV
jgi:hypothetical protein